MSKFEVRIEGRERPSHHPRPSSTAMVEDLETAAAEVIGEPPVTANGGGITQLAQLDDLKAQAQLKYSVKDYDAAAELYSQATELQAELNGEMSSKNAELLYNYGKCLYHVAVKNSDVLGSKVAGEKRDDGSSNSRAKKAKKAAKTVYYKDCVCNVIVG